MKPKNLNLKTVKQLTLGITIALIAMTLISVYNYPENLGKYSIKSFTWTISLLVVYFIFCFWIPAISSKTNNRFAIEEGTRIGAIAGFLWIVHVSIEYFVFIPKAFNGISTLGFMGILFIVFGFSAYGTMEKTRNPASAILSGVWCAMFSILVLFVYGFLLNFFFMPRLMTILQFNEEFKMSGMTIASFTIHNTLEAGGTYLLIAPIVAIVFSLLGIAFLNIQKYLSDQRAK